MAAVIVNAAAAKSLTRRHPWVFSGAVVRVEGAPAAGDTVELRAADGVCHGLGAWSPASQLAVRVWTFDPAATVDAAFFSARVARAAACRAVRPGLGEGLACRLVNAESDGLPGLIVDRYADVLVAQFLSAGSERWRAEILAALVAAVPATSVYERSDVEARDWEKLPRRAGVAWGAEPPPTLTIREGPCAYFVDVRAGQKTGFYLDQRDNRALLAEYAAGAEVLNVFSYTGAFGVRALAAGARRVLNVDSSGAALALARRNAELNGQPAEAFETLEGNAHAVLRSFRDAGRAFDAIVVDPPKFADSRRHVMAASRAYKDINLLAVKLLRPGGLLFTFSCSAHVEADLFQKIVADAALDARRELQILRRLGAADDHPTAAGFPEGTYLKGLLCRAL